MLKISKEMLGIFKEMLNFENEIVISTLTLVFQLNLSLECHLKLIKKSIKNFIKPKNIFVMVKLFFTGNLIVKDVEKTDAGEYICQV